MNGTKKKRIILLILLFFFLFFVSRFSLFAEQPRIRDGFLDLTGWDFEKQGEFTLSGEWKCMLNHDVISFIPAYYDDSGWDTYEIPHYWNKRTGTYKGIGWFRLHIYRGEGWESHGLYIHPVNTSYELYINGKKLLNNGTPGKDRKSTIPQVGEKITPLPQSCHITIAWRIANFDDPNGGPGISPLIGKMSRLNQKMWNKNFYNIMVIGIILMLAVYHIILWIVRREDQASLFLALSAFAVCLREVANQCFLERFFPEMSLYSLHWKLEAGSSSLAILFFFWFCFKMYPFVFPKKLLWFLTASILIIFLYVIIVPVIVFFSSLLFIQIIIPVAFIICIIVLINAVRKGKKDALISLAGLFLLLICITSEIILMIRQEFFLGSTNININFTPLGFILFILSQAILLAVHFAKTYKTASYLSKNLEQEVIKKTEQLEKQKKELEKVNIQLTELDQQKSLFYQNVTHELRTPLTLILGPLESLVRGFFGPLKNEIKAQLGVIRRNAGRLLQYINQLLELSKLEAGKVRLAIELVDIGKLLKYVTAIFESSFKTKGIDLKVHIPGQDCFVRGDKDKIEKIISNLLSNSLKFTGKGGKVILHLEMPYSEAAYRITVKDTGCGIPEEFLPHLFERFKQADSSTTRKYEGSGIGLSLVKEYTELHGGTIVVKSKEGEGSVFIITLPKGDIPSENEPAAGDSSLEPDIIQTQLETITEENPENGMNQQTGQPEEKSQPGEEKILIVEDNPDMRAYISGLLKNRYRIFEAENGRSGLEKAKAVQPDLIISDLMMPYMDGEELVRTIRATRELVHIPVIILTAKMADDPGTDEFIVLADDFLSKPFHPRELLSSVKNLLELKTRREKLAFFDQEFMTDLNGKSTITEKKNETYPFNPVLIIDDNEETLKNFRQLLLIDGINHITGCSDSRTVMDILKKQRVSLVILDLKMPYIPGDELLKLIKMEYPQVDVLIVTGIDDIETAVSCIREGAFNYLVKPVDIRLLLSDIRHILKIRSLEDELSNAARQLDTTGLKNPLAFSEIITVNEKMKQIFVRLEAIAGSSQPILLTGETGTGKDILPAIIHKLSGRNGKLVKVNISGLDDTMFSDVLFGHKKGAYTGAITDRKGLIEEAHAGTLFLDEIGDLSPASQVKLLNLIQNGEYYKLGSDSLMHCHTRIITATNADLARKMGKGGFREDVYHRLTYQIHLPPLRERYEDIPLLTKYFMEKAADDLGKKAPAIPDQLIPLLQTYHFPGNIRELQRLLHEALSRHIQGKLSLQYFKEYIKACNPAGMPPDGVPAGKTQKKEQTMKPGFIISFPETFPTLKKMNTKLVEIAMEKTSGNQVLAAYLLGITPSALNKRLKKTGKEE